jgi:hypothetical protein
VSISILCHLPLHAQISHGGTPISFNKLSLSTVETVVTGSVDVKAFLAEDEIEREQGLPFRFGAPFDVNYNINNSGTWDELADGSRIWRLRIESPGAFSINLIYDYFYMPPGARMFAYSGDHEMVLGAFTESNNKDHGQFSTAPVKGDVTIVEYIEPAEVRGQGVIAISRIVHAYRDIFNYGGTKGTDGFGSSGSCNNNVNCPEGDPWQDEKRAVAMVLLSGGTRWCSGAMINNTREDGTPYFLTANHCLGSESTWIIMFKYESPNCNNIDGPTSYTISGTTKRANYSTSDFGLLELSSAPPESYEPYYAGWSNIDTPSPSSVGIHHPSGDIKKISFDYDPVTSTSYLGSSGTTHWRIGNWEDGTTEGGSSGSPLFDPNHRIVGQLHGGYASCTSITSDWYGKVARSWNGGGSSSTRLKSWLDPDNTGVTTLDGYDPYAGVSIAHTPLEDTRDTLNDYEVVCLITSNALLVDLELKLHYQLGSTWYDYQLQPTGGADEFHGYIPAQSAGTTINYFLTALDVNASADTTEIYSFYVDYSAAIEVAPSLIAATVTAGDSTIEPLIIESTGNTTLDYTIAVQQAFKLGGLFSDLWDAGQTEPANRTYPEFYADLTIPKDGDDPREGFPVNKDAGGPDGFGYAWIDSDEAGGPTYSWVDISGTGTEITLGDDSYVGPISIGFDFPYYGNSYNQIYVGSNGILTFGSGSNSRTNTAIPTETDPNNMLAMWWEDLDPPENGHVYYYHDAAEERFIVSFVDIRRYLSPNGTGSYTFQAILHPDGHVIMQYGTMDPGSHADGLLGSTIGIENADGTDGLEVVFNAAYMHDNLAIEFFMPYQWLTLSQYSGSVLPGDADTVHCTFTSTELDTGLYNADIIISSNDPDPGDNPITVDAELTVVESMYLCGDANNDDDVNLGDGVYIINFVFKGGPAPDPLCQADSNGDDDVNVGDAVYLINYVFKSGPAPVEPCCP